MAERWRPVEGFEGDYEVSDWGRIRSLPGLKRSGRVLSPGMTKNGYRFVGLWRNNKATYARVHRLVATAFREREPHQDVVRHLDGDQLNNCAENLAWGTSSENAQDTVRHGRHHGASTTRCVNDHELSAENIYWYGTNRRCRTCWGRRKVRVVLQPCGTRAAYARHRYHGEEPCDPCREAARAASTRQRKKESA